MKAAAHALVHVEPGKTATLKVTPQPETASVSGLLKSGASHKQLKVEAFLSQRMPD